MTYFGVLLQFVVVPILILAALLYRDRQRGHELPVPLRFMSPWLALGALVIIAVVYTTPWDNYLVATRVWWYDPALVTGLTLGWVPIEEYAFFVLQTVLAGLWLLFLARRIPVGESVVETILGLVRSGRPDSSELPLVREHVAWGPGPRASQARAASRPARASAGRPGRAAGRPPRRRRGRRPTA